MHLNQIITAACIVVEFFKEKKTVVNSWTDCLWHKQSAVFRDKVRAWPLCRPLSLLQGSTSWTSSRRWLVRSWRWRWCRSPIWGMSWSPSSTTWWTGSRDAVAISNRYTAAKDRFSHLKLEQSKVNPLHSYICLFTVNINCPHDVSYWITWNFATVLVKVCYDVAKLPSYSALLFMGC